MLSRWLLNSWPNLVFAQLGIGFFLVLTVEHLLFRVFMNNDTFYSYLLRKKGSIPRETVTRYVRTYVVDSVGPSTSLKLSNQIRSDLSFGSPGWARDSFCPRLHIVLFHH